MAKVRRVFEVAKELGAPFIVTQGSNAAITESGYPQVFRTHLIDPRSVVPESNMPGFPWLAVSKLDGSDTAAKMRALRSVGVPYTDADIEGAQQAVAGRTEIEAVIAFLQQLGTHLTARR